MGLLAKLVGNKSGYEPRGCSKKPVSLYRGVQIVANNDKCCRPARVLAGQRFLSDEIPKLPLEQCDAAECRCTYKLFDDRRTGERRLSDFGFDIVSELRTDNDQRSNSHDRRAEPKDNMAVLDRISTAFR